MAADPIACGSSVLRAIPNSQPLRGQEFGNSGIWESRRSRPAASPAFCHSEAAAEESPPALAAVRCRRDPSLRFRMTKARGGCRRQPLVVAACSGRFPIPNPLGIRNLGIQESGNPADTDRQHPPPFVILSAHAKNLSYAGLHRTGGRSFTAVQDDKGTGWLPTLSLVILSAHAKNLPCAGLHRTGGRSLAEARDDKGTGMLPEPTACGSSVLRAIPKFPNS